MAALKQAFSNISDQVGGLSATAKLLIGALMVILVMSLLLVAIYAGRPALGTFLVLLRLGQLGLPHGHHHLRVRHIFRPASRRNT